MESPSLNPARTGRVTRAFLPLSLAALAACSGAPESVTIGLGDGGTALPAIRAIQDELSETPLPFEVRFDQSALDSGDQTADGAVARALALTSDPTLVSVIGHSGSRGTLSAAPIYSNADVPMISPWRPATRWPNWAPGSSGWSRGIMSREPSWRNRRWLWSGRPPLLWSTWRTSTGQD